MEVKQARQVLKGLSDDTRLRILNLVREQPLTVTELTDILKVSQPNLSKHLAKLRMLDLIGDKREGMNVIYYMPSFKDKSLKRLVSEVLSQIEDATQSTRDLEVLEALAQKSARL